MTYPVTPKDREAAADALQAARPILADEVRAGRMGDYAGVQAFARHRCEALEEAAKVAENMPAQIYKDAGIGPAGRSCKAATFDDAATAIRALKEPKE